jgi:hypothetical protein
MFHHYRHESAIYPSLSRIPLHVRMKLDVTGIKISLKDWLAFSIAERTVVCHLPVETEDEKQAFSSYLDFLSRRYRGVPVMPTPAVSPSAWESAHWVPAPVAGKSAPEFPAVTIEEWQHWKSHQRYALYKTALSQSEPELFFAVLKEFRELKD